MSEGSFAFPAENLLADVPPNYAMERMLVAVLAFVVGLVSLTIMPVLVTQQNQQEKLRLQLLNQPNKQAKKSEEPTQEEQPVNVDFATSGSCALAGILMVFLCIAFFSPDNTYTTNGIFQVPVLTRDECQTILDFADQAAMVNYERAMQVDPSSRNETVQQFLSEPHGWNKLRHQVYPTTDLNLVTDPFTKSQRDWIQQKLDARLVPTLERVWGIPASSIRANDLFVIQYDAEKRSHLINHTDDASISINILLNDGFEGGGTRFWDRIKGEPIAHIHPTQVGQTLFHSALLNHEGMHVEKGIRTILVGFLEVDKVNPFTKEPTGLSWFASWGSIVWLANRMKAGYYAAHHRLEFQIQDWKNSKYIRSFMASVRNVLGTFADIFFKHKVHMLVDDENREAFLQALDRDYAQKLATNQVRNANWFSGQQITIDITGEILHEWSSRSNNAHRFQEL